MQSSAKSITTAVTGMLALLALSGTATAGQKEPCFGVAKAGQNGCNSNANKHSCAGRAKIDNDPNDYTMTPKGSCLKVGGKREAATKQSNA